MAEISIKSPGTRRRELLRWALGGVATAGLASGTLRVPGLGLHSALSLVAAENGGGLLAPRPTHFPPRARRLLFIFLTGGFSHVDTFDPKPKLKDAHGKPIPAFGLRPDESKPMPLLGSPFQFSPRGRSGLLVSELFPNLGAFADDLCVIRTLHTDIVEHFQATLAMHTGSATVPMPSIGSWLSYAIGTFNRNLPSYVVLSEHLPYAGAQVWDSSFLPPEHQGVRIVPGDAPIPDMNAGQSDESSLIDDFDSRAC